MIPALALFYGGMVGSRRILDMMMMCFGGASLVAVLWALFGYSMAFGTSIGGLGLLGDVSEYAGTGQLLAEDPAASIPPILFAASVVGGWIANNLGAIDFAGGLAVHMTTGIAGLALSLVLGRSHGWPKVDHAKPHSRPLVLVGAGLLWVGWFGFNAGSALSAGQSASVVFLNTAVAASAALLAWALVERIRNGAATSMGAASGLISALVAITPACGAVSQMGALAIGAIAGAVCSLAIGLKFRLGFDDSLDVVGVHQAAASWGPYSSASSQQRMPRMESPACSTAAASDLLGVQALATIAVLVYSFVVTWIIAQIIQGTIGLRIEQEDELRGIDIAAHSEFAYLTDEDPVDLGAPRT